MTRLLSLLFIMLTFTVGSWARTYVLATGVSNYNNPNINNLAQATKDTKAFAALAKSKYPDTSILTSSNANVANVKEKLQAILNRAGENDQVIFFFSGHGGNGFIALVDNVLRYSDLIAMAEKSKAGHITYFIDACLSGSALNAMKAAKDRNALNPNLSMMVSSRGTESSLENKWVGAGFFTQALIKGLRGMADDNNDKNISLKEVFKYTFNDVTARTKSEQHPQLFSPEKEQSNVLMSW